MWWSPGWPAMQDGNYSRELNRGSKMSERSQHNVCFLVVPMKWSLIAAIAVYLLATLGGWLIGLPVQAAPSTAEAAALTSPSPAPATVTDSLSPLATSDPAADVLTDLVEAVTTPTPPSTTTTTTSSLLYAVQEGDTLGSIAQARGVSIEHLIAVNDLADPDVLYVGQTLVVPDGSTSALVTPPSTSPQVPAPTGFPSEPMPIPLPAQPAAVDEDRWIAVDLSEQLLTAYEGSTPVHSTLVSTGLPGTPTPVGQFRIWIKLRYDDMAGADYYIEDVPYVMYFHEGYGLHGVTWHGNFGHPMSHGCVNLPTSEAEWLFNWADVGTLVNVHD